ncbi:MAG: tetratricopeptide repeat protein [Bacillota bacterium]|nr:tetratricopeptide repeat protein [Bacillota bacterium]
MTITEAKSIIDEYEYKSVLTDDEEFLLLEALEFMINTTKETEWMVRLGGYHYDKRNFDLALKYYEMADELGDKWAAEGLGYIWYYGRTGEKDYKKAFDYYHKAMDNGNLKSMVKVADMYKNGYGVDKNYDMYVELIEAAYTYVKGVPYLSAPQPEVYTRLARIRQKQGRTDEAIDLYVRAKDFLAQRITYNPFFGDLNIMKWLEEELYELIDFDRADFDLYDLYALLKQPVRIAFAYDGKMYEVESVEEDGSISIRFGDSWYRDIDDFFAKATIAGERIPVLYEKLYAFKVV